MAGDHVAIYPVNDAESVTRIGELLNTDLDTVVTLTNVDGEAPVVCNLDEIQPNFGYFHFSL